MCWGLPFTPSRKAAMASSSRGPAMPASSSGRLSRQPATIISRKLRCANSNMSPALTLTSPKTLVNCGQGCPAAAVSCKRDCRNRAPAPRAASADGNATTRDSRRICAASKGFKWERLGVLPLFWLGEAGSSAEATASSAAEEEYGSSGTTCF